MVNNVHFSPSFCKQLKAKANIINNGKPEQCFIYELNTTEDIDYFKELRKMPEWSKTGFADVFNTTLKNKYSCEHLFSMETGSGECLGILELDDDTVNGEFQKVEYLETFEPCSYRNLDRDRKYIGQTLMAFAAKSLDEEINKEGLCIPVAVYSSVPFYVDKCYFTPSEDEELEWLFLSKKDFGKLITKNEENTHGKLELIG